MLRLAVRLIPDFRTSKCKFFSPLFRGDVKGRLGEGYRPFIGAN